MTTTNQGMSFEEIEQIVAERVANGIETIAIYDDMTRQWIVISESMSQTKRHEEKTPVLGAKQRPSVAKQKAEVTCYECGILGHYQSNCPMWKFRKHVNKYCKEKALKDSSVAANNVDV
ncbi:reverse transcriptase domain-containing protein [Tanacetum coccineum]